MRDRSGPLEFISDTPCTSSGAPPVIGPHATLLFEVELLSAAAKLD